MTVEYSAIPKHFKKNVAMWLHGNTLLRVNTETVAKCKQWQKKSQGIPHF